MKILNKLFNEKYNKVSFSGGDIKKITLLSKEDDKKYRFIK
jgi:hypothetical protein